MLIVHLQNHPHHDSYFQQVHGTVNVTFHNNQAHAAGNSIFFNSPVDVSSDIIRDPSNERSIMYIPKKF